MILNILSRRREPPRLLTIVTSADLALAHPPVTTNLAFGEWPTVFGDPKMTTALLDRIS